MMKMAISRLALSGLIGIALSYPNSLWGQIVGADALSLKNLTFHNKPPKYLNARRTAVFLSVPKSKKNPTQRENWKKLAHTIHPQLKKMKVDAMAYFYTDDAMGSPDIANAFSKMLTKRDVKYILLVEQTTSADPMVEDHFVMTVVPFNKNSTFLNQHANAWKVEGNGLKTVLKDMFKAIYRAGLNQENYLIPDFPEIFTDVDIFQSKRIPTYAMDLKVEPLMVPRFQKLVIKDSLKLDESTMRRVRAFNNTIDDKNRRLAEIMSDYPLKYELVDEYTDKDIYSRGGQYVLIRMDGEGKNIKQLLDYDTPLGESMYATIKATEMGSTVRRLPVDAVVSKYYVKHAFTHDVYTGLKWDADLTWEEALQNFIFNMKDILKVQ